MENREEENVAPAAVACTAEPDSDSGGDSDSCSDGDMLALGGVGVPLQDWVGEGEQEQAQDALGEHCDGYSSSGSAAVLDGHDNPSELSDGPLDSGEESDVRFDGDGEPRSTGGAAKMGGACEESGAKLDGGVEHGDRFGAAANGDCCSSASGEKSAAAARQSVTAVRRSSRETSRKEYFPPQARQRQKHQSRRAWTGNAGAAAR